MTFATTDICDDNPGLLEDGRLAVLPPVFKHYGLHTKFCGPAVTLKVFEDNVLVRATLETPGNGSVLVVDGGGSIRRPAGRAGAEQWLGGHHRQRLRARHR